MAGSGYLRENYLSSAGGYPNFNGSFRWGVIDKTYILPQGVGGIQGVVAVKFGVRVCHHPSSYKIQLCF